MKYARSTYPVEIILLEICLIDPGSLQLVVPWLQFLYYPLLLELTTVRVPTNLGRINRRHLHSRDLGIGVLSIKIKHHFLLCLLSRSIQNYKTHLARSSPFLFFNQKLISLQFHHSKLLIQGYSFPFDSRHCKFILISE